MKSLFFLLFFLLGLSPLIKAQEGSRISGNLQANGNFFITDERIRATGTPQYDNQKFSAENWLNLNYSNWGFDIGVRFDLFNNSNLLNPNGGSFTGEGIGRWYVNKRVDKFEFSGGYLYDQIGSGIIFRAYEERSLLIDNALFGVRAAYHFNDNWQVKAFTGRIKRQFSTYNTIVRGGALEGFVQLDSARNISIAPGLGMVGRTYGDETVTRIVNSLSTYLPQDSISPQYNTYAFTLYNTLTAGNFTWYIEGAYKTEDVIFDPFIRTASGSRGKLINPEGYTVYTSFAWAKNGLGITLEGKRTENFSFRNTPFDVGIQGTINFLPPMARQNAYRLPARFSPATQELGEQAVQLDVRYALNKKLTLSLNVSEIQLLDGTELYREIGPEVNYKYARKWQVLAGVQLLKYNMPVYRGESDPEDPKDPIAFLGGGDADYVDAITWYGDWLYKFTSRRSLRVEGQYLLTDDEFGSWVNILAEVSLAPHWQFYLSDMYKLKHGDNAEYTEDQTFFDGLHYPSLGVVYSHRSNRFSLAYVKQVEGINCAGGICRYEPTFHGVRLNISSSF